MANQKLKPNQFLLPCGAMITERPILFSTDMVHANLVDRKTQTRRTKGLKEINYTPELWRWIDNVSVLKSGDLILGFKDPMDSLEIVKSPYGKPGDLLWVRETWFKIDPDHGGDYAYKATMASESDKIRKDCIKAGRKYQWKPSIHMPKVASRIWAMVEEIRVERLQDISEADAIAEGILPINQHGQKVWKRYDGYYTVTSKPLVSFWSLWASINGEDSWLSNPWVWVVKYRILSKSGKPSIETIEKTYLEITGKEVSHA